MLNIVALSLANLIVRRNLTRVLVIVNFATNLITKRNGGYFTFVGLNYRKPGSICLNRRREESLGNDDVSIVCARKYEMVRMT